MRTGDDEKSTGQTGDGQSPAAPGPAAAIKFAFDAVTISKVVEQQVFASIQCKRLAALVMAVPGEWLAQQMARQVKRGASHDLVHRERVMLGATCVVVLRMFQLGCAEEERASAPVKCGGRPNKVAAALGGVLGCMRVPGKVDGGPGARSVPRRGCGLDMYKLHRKPFEASGNGRAIFEWIVIFL